MGEAPTVFEATAAHAFVIGTSCFGIFWGVTNVLFIRNLKFEESVIAQALGKKNKSE
jgi:hypothetical protein